MSFLFGLSLSSGTTITILGLSGKTPWLKEQFMASAKGFARIPPFSFMSFGGIVFALIILLTLICFK